MKNRIYLILEYLWWRACLWMARPFSKTHSGRRVVIVPCEPGTVIGSRGDEAMITAICEAEKRADKNVEIVFLTGCRTFEGIERFEGSRVVHGWCGRNILLHVMRTIRAEAPDAVYALGADCMDGKYSARVSQILVGAAAYAAACGAEAHLTGFSFNETPAKELRRVFRAAAKYLAPYNLRDAVSQDRFERFTGVAARLVADTAFGMTPQANAATEKWCAWCETERAEGRVVIGLNLNGMLFPKDESECRALIGQLAEEVKPILSERVSFLLIPLDYRGGGDLSCLESLFDALKGCAHVAIVRDILSAPQLKALVGGIDALFTCRMHLAIAALGRGKPVSGFAYQGKFEGLLRHFDLPGNLVGTIEDKGAMERIVRLLVREMDRLTKLVESNLPRISEMATLNVCGGDK